MLFGNRLNTIILIAVVAGLCNGVDQDSRGQLGLFQRKPHGPFYCKARCVAMCLEDELAKSMDKCKEEFCSNFDQDTPCPRNDTECWTNCGRRLEGPQSSPPPVENVQAEFDRIGNDIDPYTARITWDPQDAASLYILEIFPVKTGFGAEESRVVQMMTQDIAYQFTRPNLCEVYMARIMAVTGRGMSAPRYRRLNAYIQSLEDIDLHLAPSSMFYSSQDPYPVKVTFQYSMPQTWKSGDLEITDSNVRAFDCDDEIDRDAGFADTKPDSDGFLWPVVFINVTDKEIQLSFPADAMYPKCKFLFKILALRTRCGFKSTSDEENKRNEVPFAMNCQTVQNANCEPKNPAKRPDPLKLIVDPEEPPMDDSRAGQLRPLIFGKPTNSHGRSSEEESDRPRSPWDANSTLNDTLWSLFESFLRGFEDGNSENSTKNRKRVMPDEPDNPFDGPEFVGEPEGSSSLPPAPIAPIDTETSSQDEDIFEYAFVQSIDGQSGDDISRSIPEMPTPIPQPADPSAESSDTSAPTIDSDTTTTAENPQLRGIKDAATDGLPLWFSPIDKVNTTQAVALLCLLAGLICFIVFFLWLTSSRKSRRKESEVPYYPM